MAGRRVDHPSWSRTASEDSRSSSISDPEWSDDSCETDFTELESPADVRSGLKQRLSARKESPPSRARSAEASSDETVYADPADDTDKNLSDIDSDFERAEGTKRLRNRIEVRWSRFCKVKAAERLDDRHWHHPEEALREATANDIYRFFNWCLKLQHGKRGRRLRGIKKVGALKADWKYFGVYYTKITGEPISQEIRKKARKGIRSLMKEYDLDDQPRDNIPVYIEDLLPFNETILQTQEKRFHLGLQRIILCLYNMMSLFMVSRKRALLNIQYKHLRVTIQRDPHGGPPRPTIDIQPKYIKKFLGFKGLNTFSFPEIIYGVSLVFSLHTFLFGVLLHAKAFGPGLRSMEQVRRLWIRRGGQQMELPLDPSMRDYYVFCKVEVVGGQVRILRHERMSDAALSGQIRSCSMIHGFLNPFFTHQSRYGGGALLDKSGHVTDAGRNLMMNHSNSKVFLDHYRPRRHTIMQEIIHGLEPDQEWERALTSIQRWRDQRLPRHLNDDEKARVEADPELQMAIREHQTLEEEYDRNSDPALIPRLEEARRKVTNTRQRLRYKRQKEVRQEFGPKQAAHDIAGQLSGSITPDDDLPEDPPMENMPPEQVRLVETLLAVPTEWTLEAEWQRRNAAVDAIVTYCGYEEGGPLRGRRKQTVAVEEEGEEEEEEEEEDQAAQAGSEVESKGSLGLLTQDKNREPPKPTVCFQCGKKYSQYQGLLRHFRPAHLNDRKCKRCEGMEFLLQMHWQRHVADVHRLKT